MSTRVLTVPLSASLVAARDAVIAAPADPEGEVWILPPGDHALNVIALDLSGRHVRVTGRSRTLLIMQGGGLELRGGDVVFEDVALELVAGGDTAALHLVGDRVTVEGVQLRQIEGDDVRALRIEAHVSARVVAVTVDGVTGDIARGVEVFGGEIDVAGIRVENLIAANGVAVGVELQANGSIEANDLTVRGLTGDSCGGVYAGATAAASIVELLVEDLNAGVGSAFGAALAAHGRVSVFGFTVRRARGGRVHGLFATSADAIEVALGGVRGLSAAGATAIGIHLDGSNAPGDVIARDLTVEGVEAANPPPDRRAPAVWAAYADAMRARVRPGSNDLSLLELPAPDDVAGLRVIARVDGDEAFLDERSPSAMRVEDSILRFVRGTSLEVDAAMRPARVQRVEAYTGWFGGYVASDELTLAQLTWHRHQEGLRVGPGFVELYASIFSAAVQGPSLDVTTEDGVELERVEGAFAVGAPPPIEVLDGDPYRGSGPAALPPPPWVGIAPVVDLRLAEDHVISAVRVALLGDDHDVVPVGAHPLEAEPRCALDDPLPLPVPPRALPAGPALPVDYRARDARGLLRVMMERARVAMPEWTRQEPADFTTMIFEALAHQLDHLAYAQERVVAEGNLSDAVLRRSLEDHVRPLDYDPDPGLSATAMIRIDWDGVDDLVLPAGILVANESPSERSVVFATEAALAYHTALRNLELLEDVAPGDTSALIAGHFDLDVLLSGRLSDRHAWGASWRNTKPGRWLVLSNGAVRGGEAVFVTQARSDADRTRVFWDPRRPATQRYIGRHGEEPAEVFANVVPAHHGLPMTPLGDVASNDRAVRGPGLPEPDLDDPLAEYRALLSPISDGSREVLLPVAPLSVVAQGFPLLHEATTRPGDPMIALDVEGDDESWTLVRDLCVHEADDKVFVLRAASPEGLLLYFGDGTNGARLPGERRLSISLSVGLGRGGNVGAGVLTRLLSIPRASDPRLDRPMEELRGRLLVSNPLPALGGRDPEPLSHLRYLAPLGVSDARSAVTPADFERLLRELNEVAGTHASVVDLGYRRVVRVTTLLADIDDLERRDEDEEILRRWSEARRRLEEIRLLGFDVEVRPPRWVPLDLDLSVDAAPHARASWLELAVAEAVAGEGGVLDPDRIGLGGDVHLSLLYQAVAKVEGVESVRVLRFRRLDPGAVDHFDEGVIPMGPDEVAFVRASERSPIDGVLTVTVCGGLA